MAEWILEEETWWYYYGDGLRKRGKLATCPACGITFPRRGRTYVDRKHHLRFCSAKCSGVHTAKSGEDNPKWKGGREIDRDGYVRLWIINGCGKRILEHRMVMEEYLGRTLRKGETVHHVNGDRQDNRIENLQLRIKNHGPGQHYVCADCGSNRLTPTNI